MFLTIVCGENQHGLRDNDEPVGNSSFSWSNYLPIPFELGLRIQ